MSSRYSKSRTHLVRQRGEKPDLYKNGTATKIHQRNNHSLTVASAKVVEKIEFESQIQQSAQYIRFTNFKRELKRRVNLMTTLIKVDKTSETGSLPAIRTEKIASTKDFVQRNIAYLESQKKLPDEIRVAMTDGLDEIKKLYKSALHAVDTIQKIRADRKSKKTIGENQLHVSQNISDEITRLRNQNARIRTKVRNAVAKNDLESAIKLRNEIKTTDNVIRLLQRQNNGNSN